MSPRQLLLALAFVSGALLAIDVLPDPVSPVSGRFVLAAEEPLPPAPAPTAVKPPDAAKAPPPASAPSKTAPAPKKEDPPSKPPTAKKSPPVPEKVLKVLEYVDKYGKPMEGYVGGGNFGNFEKRLPQTDDTGRRIKYREWDVNPKRQGVNRGAERLVTGSDKHAYYTADHYNTFRKIR